MEGSKLTKRQLQAIETKKRIIRCAKKLINTKGYDQISVAQISKSASITVGTFYHYFTSKEALLYELLPKVSSYLESEWAAQSKEECSFNQIVAFFEWLYQYPYNNHREIMKQILTSTNAIKSLDSDRLNVLEQLIRQGQEAGEFTMKYNSLYISKLIWHSNRGIFHHCMLEPGDIDYRTSAHDVISRIAYTFLTQKGRDACKNPDFILE